ncbi:MAG TPA: acyltransferase family protein [Gemmatales bacterium]|nr:acyltransferase family protein [Gemmatales bacterium]
MTTTPAALPASDRLIYLDQFRGYTVFGMIVVNFLGAYSKQVHPILLHHNTYCSYADTIMAQFFFAVGFALRFTLVKRLRREGPWAAHKRIVQRVFALLLVGALVHGFNSVGTNWQTLTTEKDLFYWLYQVFTRDFFQTLTHIAVTTLWVLPVIGRSWPIRMAWLLGSALLHVYLSHEFYLKFALERPVIDGGPLGFLTWSIPVLAGSFISDLVTAPGQKQMLGKLVIASLVVMALGYAVSCLNYPPAPGRDPEKLFVLAAPPFLPPYDPQDPEASYQRRHNLDRKQTITLWTMSQQTGASSYLIFGAGFSILVLAFFYWLYGTPGASGSIQPSGRPLVPESRIFRSLGSNALIAYIVHAMAIDVVQKLYPKDSPLWVILIGLVLVMAITWLICAWLERRGWYVRV